MSRIRNILWLLLFVVPSALLALETPKYQIEGVVLSQRDGAPVPFCRLSVEAAPSSTPAQPGTGPRSAANLRFSGRQRSGSLGGRPIPTRASPAHDGKTEVVADARGRFTVEVPQAGSWQLTGAARGFHSQIFEEHQGFYTAIVLTPDAPVFHATFRMNPDATIKGLVLDEAGEAVRTAQVTAERILPELPGESIAADDASARPVQFATTDDRGAYELAGLAPGAYLVRVQAQPWYASSPGIQRSAGAATNPAATPQDSALDVVYPNTWFPAAFSQAQAEPLVLSGGEERQADFHLSPIPAVHLEVPRPDSPAPEPGRPRQFRPASIHRIAADGSGALSSVTMTSGSGSGWEFSGLAPGTYEVYLPGPDAQSEGETRQLEVRPGASGLITLEGAIPLTRVTVQIDGVPDSDIAAVEFVDTDTGRRIFAMQPPGRRGRRLLDEDTEDNAGDEQPGTGRIALLPPHAYDVVLVARSDVYLSSIEATGNGTKASGTQVSIGGGAPVLRLHIARGRGTVAGFAQLPAGPAQGALVLLVPTTLGTPGSTLPVLRDQANSDGSFRFTAVTPGKYILLAIDRGWDVHWNDLKDPQSLERYLLKGIPIDLRPAARLTQTIPAQAP